MQCDLAQNIEQSLLNLRTHYENNGSKRTGGGGTLFTTSQQSNRLTKIFDAINPITS